MTLISNRKPGQPENSPTEPLKKAVSSALRAMAGKEEVEVQFAADRPSLIDAGEMARARLPEPPRKPSAKDVAILRGHADSFALKLALHDQKLHRKVAPEPPEARKVFDAVEQARCDAIGARRMMGVGTNIGAMLEDRYARANLAAVSEIGDAPIEDAMAMLVRERLTGLAPPPSAERLTNLWRERIEEKAGTTLDQLAGQVQDQQAFSKLVHQMLVQMGLEEGDPLGSDDEDQQSDDQDDAGEQEPQEGESGEAEEQDGFDMQETEALSEESAEGAQEAADAPPGEYPDESEMVDAEEPAEAARQPQKP
ncbi:MAG: cobaltochelatase subunit CobT, partial [Methylobacterium sp.]|nr:cobaltochelatase subunit CobT [Methylobacterium sp.]